MEPHELAIAAKYVGAGLEGQFGRLIFGFAVTEALGIFALLISFLLLFAV
jgi:F-type H+-transporting ATPase subunit c